MAVNLHAEHLYDQIELARGAGSRKRGHLCIMSFVAYLANERHTDHPRTASPFIRNFAIQLNDGVPWELRRDLKPFAPRIIGTNDGHDLERAPVSFEMVMKDLLPTAMRDFPDCREYPAIWLGNRTPFSVAAGWGDGPPTNSIGSRFRAIRQEYERGDFLAMATRIGHLLVALIQCAPSSAAQRWYWAKALDLLDQLCDVGADRRAKKSGPENVIRIAAQRDSSAGVTPCTAALPKMEQRPLQKISRALRAALQLISA